METENTPKKIPWIAIIIIVIIILAIVQWVQTKPKSPVDSSDTSATSTTASATDGAVSVVSVGTTSTSTITNPSVTNKNFMHIVTLETNKGTIVFHTYDADAPKATTNFVTLAEKGFYTNIIFHRVISGFMIQGGDPTGTGSGGPGYAFADELNPTTDSAKAGYVRGTVAMANAGPNTNGSQFFIMHKDTPLPHNYTIFGKVIQGIEVVDAIAATKTGAGDRPLEDVVIKKVTISQSK